MDLQINKERPLIMHIDLNSCFATIEQQANPLLRGKPIVVAAYSTPNGCILAPSIEAKRFGIKTGMRIRDARILYPNLIIRTPDPPKYRDVHEKFMKIFHTYSPKVAAKSIDEAIIDFHLTQELNPDLILVGKQVKQRIKQEIGEWIVCSIGISTNRFLAKLAAGLHKPDGLDVIDHTNLLSTYEKVKLIDFCGINTRYQARLNINGIFTPMDFFKAESRRLSKQIFRSIVGRYWHERLHGWEVDDLYFDTKTIGHQYALKIPTNDRREVSRLLMKLCEKMGRRMRSQGFSAKGIHVALTYKDKQSLTLRGKQTGQTSRSYWHKAKIARHELYTTTELYKYAQLVLNESPLDKLILKLSVNCYNLTKNNVIQGDLFGGDILKIRKASDAMDAINDTYGEFTITPATMMGMDKIILDRIAFGKG